MKTFRMITTVLSMVLLLTFIVSAQESKTEVVKEPVPVKELTNQTHCPVMGGKIDSSVYTDIQGQRVYHCCPMCSSKLTAAPDKYFKETAAKGILFENIQETCPVTGGKLRNKSIFTDYEGRRIYFGSTKCSETFAKTPDKFLQKMDEPAPKIETIKVENKKIDHTGHDHK
ncbi:MAG: hypothetical protein ACE5D6_00775 [Candidatus Zixiibacteriota bacterium]